jgi:hypothetical protein
MEFGIHNYEKIEIDYSYHRYFDRYSMDVVVVVGLDQKVYAVIHYDLASM